MRLYFPDLVSAIDVKKEQPRIARIDFLKERTVRTYRVTSEVKTPELIGSAKTLDDAEQLFLDREKSAGNVSKAKELFLKAIKDWGDFVRIAKAYGIPAAKVRTERGARAAVRRMFEAKGPFLLEVELGQQTQVNPKLLVNRPIEDMFPFLPREELREEMIVPPLEEE